MIYSVIDILYFYTITHIYKYLSIDPLISMFFFFTKDFCQFILVLFSRYYIFRVYLIPLFCPLSYYFPLLSLFYSLDVHNLRLGLSIAGGSYIFSLFFFTRIIVFLFLSSSYILVLREYPSLCPTTLLFCSVS